MFKSIVPILEKCDLKMILSMKNGIMTVTTVPYNETSSGVKPLMMSGTPEEIELNFLPRVLASTGQIRQYSDNLDTKAPAKPTEKRKLVSAVTVPVSGPTEVVSDDSGDEETQEPAVVESKPLNPVDEKKVKEKPLPLPTPQSPTGITGDLFAAIPDPPKATPLPATPAATVTNAEGDKVAVDTLRVVQEEKPAPAPFVEPADDDW